MTSAAVHVATYETAQNGLVLYSIHSSPDASRVVKHRYSDFLALNDRLERAKLPTVDDLPGKLWVHSDANLRQRRAQLDKALRKYVEKRGTNAVLDAFLGIRPTTAATSPTAALTSDMVFSPSRSTNDGDDAVEAATGEEAAAAVAPTVARRAADKITSVAKAAGVYKVRSSSGGGPLPSSTSLAPSAVAALVVVLVLAHQARKRSGSSLVGLFTLASAAVAANAVLSA